MKSKGFWKQKNGEYLPHPNCKCRWEEKREGHGGESFRKQNQSGVTLNRTKDNTFEGEEVEFRVAGAPGRLGVLGGGISIDGFEEMLSKLEKKQSASFHRSFEDHRSWKSGKGGCRIGPARCLFRFSGT